MNMHLAESRPVAAPESLIDWNGLEQFASTIAAMAYGHAAAEDALDLVMHSLAQDRNRIEKAQHYSGNALLRERALRYGFRYTREMRIAILPMVREAMMALYGHSWKRYGHC